MTAEHPVFGDAARARLAPLHDVSDDQDAGVRIVLRAMEDALRLILTPDGMFARAPRKPDATPGGTGNM